MNINEASRYVERALRSGSSHHLKSIQVSGLGHWRQLRTPQAWWEGATKTLRSSTILPFLASSGALKGLSWNVIHDTLLFLAKEGNYRALSWALSQSNYFLHDAAYWSKLLSAAASSHVPTSLRTLKILVNVKLSDDSDSTVSRTLFRKAFSAVLDSEMSLMIRKASVIFPFVQDESTLLLMDITNIPSWSSSPDSHAWRLLEWLLNGKVSLTEKVKEGVNVADLINHKLNDAHPEVSRVWALKISAHLSRRLSTPCASNASARSRL